MKKIIAGLLAALILLPACGKKSEESNAAQPAFANIKNEASYKLTVPDEIAQGRDYYSTAKVDLTVPADSTSEISKRLLAAAFPEDSVSKGFNTAVAKFISTPVDFLQTGAEKISTIPIKPENGVLLSKNIVIDTLRQAKDIMTFHIVSQGFTGGAHGYYSAAYVNYNIADNTVVDAGKLFADNNGVRQLILNQLAKDNGCKIEELESNGVVFSVADVKVPENFYPEGDSLVFYYNPYEISSWAQGEIKVAVPTVALTAYVSDYGKEFLKTTVNSINK